MLTALLVLTFACLGLAAVMAAMECYVDFRDGRGEIDASKTGESLGRGHPR